MTLVLFSHISNPGRGLIKTLMMTAPTIYNNATSLRRLATKTTKVPTSVCVKSST